MFTPMFLVPGRAEGAAIDQVALNWYMDDQYVGHLIFNISEHRGKNLTFYPRLSHYNSGSFATHDVETGNLPHPIAGFDGWIGPNNQPYQNVTVSGSNIWQYHSLYDYPLFGSKGVFAVDRHNSPTRGVVASLAFFVDGVAPFSPPEIFVAPSYNRVEVRNIPLSASSHGSIPYADINLAARYVAMTLEVS